MKITKTQLAQIVQEELTAVLKEHGTRHAGVGLGSKDTSKEYQRGYQDGKYGEPPVSDVGDDYDAGYQAGRDDADADAERDYEMGHS